MALVLKDRVRETTAVIGTNDATLLGAVTGFQAFSAVGSGNTCYYTISDQAGSNWEVGIGTYNSVGPTLTRDTILASSNSDSKVNFPSGTKDVFLTYPSEKAVYLDAAGNLDIEGAVVINANTSSDALRITQSGSGNALLVEDSANPDSTPFVVDASGNVVIGATASQFNFPLEIYTTTSKGIVFKESSADTATNSFYFRKSRGTTPTSVDIVANGDGLGSIYFQGTDGVNGLNAAGISAGVDGVPGVNDMPGRLVFSTTSDGASNTTERMRIDSAGRIGVGGPGSVNSNAIFTIGGIAISGTDFGFLSNRTAGSGTTTQLSGFNTSLSTSAASFTLGNMYHFAAQYQGIGAGSTVTNQIGFYAAAALTGATNNYAFYGNISSGTGRFNVYAAGSAANYLAGYVGIGTANPDSYGKLAVVGGQAATSSSSAAFVTPGSGQGELADISLYGTFQNTGDNGPRRTADIIAGFNAGAWGTEYLSFNVGNGGASNDSRVVTSEKMRITSTGNVGVGYAGSTYAKFGLSATATPSYGLSYGYYNTTTISSSLSVTDYRGFYSEITTAAASWNLPTLVHFMASPQAFGAGSTVNNQFGFHAASTITGATNNFGLYSAIAAGSGRWNLYAGGSADNYMAGRLGVGGLGAVANLEIGKNITGNAFSVAVLSNGAVQSDATSRADYFVSAITVAAGTYNIVNGYQAQQAAITGTVSAQRGFSADSTLTGATNNFGFYSNIASGTGRWNFYANGTADNYFAGNTNFGSTSRGNALVTANSTIAFEARNAGTAYYQMYNSSAGADLKYWRFGNAGGNLLIETVNDAYSAATERMRVSSNGSVTIGGYATSDTSLGVIKSITGATSAYGIRCLSTINSDVTSSVGVIQGIPSTQAASFTVGSLSVFDASFNTKGAGSSITSLYGFVASSGLTVATNNYGFYGNIAAGTGRWNFYAAGTADNYFAGSLGIGSTTTADVPLLVSLVGTSANINGVRVAQTIPATATSTAKAFQSVQGTAASAFTLSNLTHYEAFQGTIGAGSTVTNQYGFTVTSTITGATNNYGFYSNLASGTGVWNFYAAGTAPSYFAGIVGVGVSPTGAASSKLFIAGDVTLTNTNTALFSNLYYASGFKYVGNGYGAYIKLAGSSATAFEFGIAGSNSSGAGAAATAVIALNIDQSGNVLIPGPGGLGYGTGSGGAVTQTTSRTTGVTLNKTNGAITLVSAAGSATYQSFTVTNSTVAATDTIIVNQKSGTDLYEVFVTAVAAGSFRITFATTGGTTTEQPVFNFAVIKAVAA